MKIFEDFEDYNSCLASKILSLKILVFHRHLLKQSCKTLSQKLIPFQEKITTLKILTLENFRLYSSYCLWVSSIARPLSVQALDNQVNNGQILSVDMYVHKTDPVAYINTYYSAINDCSIRDIDDL